MKEAMYIITQEQLDSVAENAAKRALRTAMREPKMLMMKQACIALGISEPTLRRMIQNDEVDAVKLAGKWKISESEIERLLPNMENLRYKRYED